MQTIYLDISNKGVIPTIYAKQGDIGRKIQVIFTDSGIPYKIPKNAKLSVWYDGDSGDGNYTDIGDKSAIVVENNKVTFELITQMLNNDGEGIVCLIMNVGKEQIGSWNIHYLCEKVPGFDSEGASSYFTAFSESINKLKNTDKTLTKEGYPADAKATGDKIDNLTAGDIGAAPSGYGLGGVPSYIADCNTVTDTGWYKWDAKASNAPFGNGIMQVIGRAKNTSALQISYMMAASGILSVAMRRINKSTGVYDEWEYVNPPMDIGVEYRTTERFNGLPVYQYLFNFGVVGVGATKTLEHGITMSQPIGYCGRAQENLDDWTIYALPVKGLDFVITSTTITGTNTSEGIPRAATYVVIKYIKQG